MLKVAPALAAGCSAVLKPAEETPLTALKLEEIFREAGLPDGVLNVITGYGETTGAALTAHPDVDKISFTGSTEVGRLIVKAAAGNLKRLTLELGGKSPLIMFDDADLDKAIMGAGDGPAGRVGAELLLHLAHVRPARHLRPGRRWPRRVRPDAADGRQRGSELGSRAADQREAAPTRVGIVSDGVAGGAQVVTGGKPMDRRGYFYEATIVTNTTPDMRLIREEIFGPVGWSSRSTRRTRRSPPPTTPSTGSPAPSGPRTSAARIGSRTSSAAASSG